MMVRHDKYMSDIDIQVNKCGCKYDPDMQMIKLKLCVSVCSVICDPMGYSPPGSSVHDILHPRTLEMGCHSILQEVLSIQRLNPRLLGLLCWQAGSLPPAPSGKTVNQLYPNTTQKV